MKTIAGILGFCLLALIAVYFYQSEEHQQLSAEILESKSIQYADLPQGFVHYQKTDTETDTLTVLVHGFSVPQYVWDPTYAFLKEKGFSVLRFDLYGRGFSARPDVDYDMDTYVTQLTGLLNALDVDKPINLVGLSMGGAVVTHFASRYPERIKRLALIAPLVKTPDQPGAALLKLPLVGEYLAPVVLVPKIYNGVEKAVHDPATFPDWKEKFHPQMQYAGFSRALLRAGRSISGQDFRPVYATLAEADFPVQLIWGSEDRTLPVAQADYVRQLVPRTQYHEIAETGHLPHYEKPEMVNPLLVDFLQQPVAVRFSAAQTPSANNKP